MHQRVVDQVQLYETTNTRILALLGVLFCFGIANANEVDDGFVFFIVNVVFVVLVPAIAFASVLFTGANLGKIMIWGDFLKIVENKVNKVLKEEALSYGFSDGRVMSWEFWRVDRGYAGTHDHWSMVTFSGMLVIAFILSAIASVIIRLRLLFERCTEHFRPWLSTVIVMAIVFGVLAVYYVQLFLRKRAESLRNAKNDNVL